MESEHFTISADDTVIPKDMRNMIAAARLRWRCQVGPQTENFGRQREASILAEPSVLSEVSQTAFNPAMALGEYTDIEMARAKLPAIRSVSGFREAEREQKEALRTFVAFFEARFKSVSRMLAEYRAPAVLELASGFSSRSIDPGLRHDLHVETDFPEMIEQKRSVLLSVAGEIPAHCRLFGANVLDQHQFAQACVLLEDKASNMITEGLLRYLTLQETAGLARSIGDVLRSHGGVWITPDVHLKTWGNYSANPDLTCFDDFRQARSFFEHCGFRVEERPLLDGIGQEIVSLPLAAPALKSELNHRRIYVLSPK